MTMYPEDELDPSDPDSDFQRLKARRNGPPMDIWDVKDGDIKVGDFKKDNIKSEQAQMMFASGADAAFVGEFFGITEAAAKRIFEKEIKSGVTLPNARVLFSLYREAIGGNVRAQIFWLERVAGLISVSRNEMTGADGKEISIADLRPVEAEQRLAHVLQAVKERQQKTA